MSNPSVLHYYLGTYLSNDGEESGNVLLKLYSNRLNAFSEAIDLMAKNFDQKYYILNIETKLSQLEIDCLVGTMPLYQ